MQHVTKILVAVLHVLLCIKYMQVPEVIDKTGRDNGFIRILKTENKKLTVFFRNTTSKAKRPSATLILVHGLDDDGLEVQFQ